MNARNKVLQLHSSNKAMQVLVLAMKKIQGDGRTGQGGGKSERGESRSLCTCLREGEGEGDKRKGREVGREEGGPFHERMSGKSLNFSRDINKVRAKRK